MQLTFDADVEAFRAEFVAFLDENLPSETEAAERVAVQFAHPGVGQTLAAAAVRSRLAAAGQSAGVRWPQRHAVPAVRASRGTVAPEDLSLVQSAGCGDHRGVAAVVRTPEQKQQWAVPILRADMTASLGMSEPGRRLGSGRSADQGRSRRRSTSWSTGRRCGPPGAHDSDVLLTFVRTDPDAPKHKGISVLLIPTRHPGVECRPFAYVYDRDHLDFNEVFFTDVRVPAENLVGPLNGGWRRRQRIARSRTQHCCG